MHAAACWLAPKYVTTAKTTRDSSQSSIIQAPVFSACSASSSSISSSSTFSWAWGSGAGAGEGERDLGEGDDLRFGAGEGERDFGAGEGDDLRFGAGEGERDFGAGDGDFFAADLRFGAAFFLCGTALCVWLALSAMWPSL
jgi:hypothetical protein